METNCRSDEKHCNDMKKKETMIKKVNEIKKTKWQSNDKNKEGNEFDWLSKVTIEDLKSLCNQLSIFNTRVQTIKGVSQLRYDLPNKLQLKLEVEAEELGSLYRELHDAIKNLELMHNQRTALLKEKLCTETQLDKLKADTESELEVIVSVYDSPMLDTWQAVKSGNNVMAVENFLQDVKGKLQAMKNLQILGTQKLADLKKEEMKKEQNNFKKEKNINLNSNQSGASLSECNTNNSQTSLRDSEFLDEDSLQSTLYNLVSDHVLALPSWVQGVVEVD